MRGIAAAKTDGMGKRRAPTAGRRMRAARPGLLALMLVGAAMIGTSPALAQRPPISEGHYVMDGGSYAITVQRTADGIMVREPNKDARYRQEADGEYSFYNENSGSTFGIRVVDARTIEVFRKNPPGNSSSRMTLVGEPPVRDANDPATVAIKYRDLARTDPTNAQSWSFCSAAALKRSTADKAEADAYGVKSAQALGLIIVDRAASPCPDAIPQPLWARALAEEPLASKDKAPAATAKAQPATRAPTAAEAAETAERERLNGESAAKAAADAERFRRMREQQAAGRAAYEQAQAQFARDRAAYEAQAAEAKAAADAYDRAMAEYRARTGQAR